MNRTTGATQAAKERYSRPLVNFLRAGRNFAYLLLTPFDYACRLINGKADFPPLHLRRHVGPLRTFEASGAEFMSYLQLLVGMHPGERILDVGCGCGLMALHMKEYLDKQGGYVGLDLHGPSINWCRRHIGEAHKNFDFKHIDVQSLAYNPRGEVKGEHYIFPYDSKSFDVVLLKSVFTHMRPAEVENYLGEVARMLTENGRCLATFFLLNQEQRALAAEERNVLNFSFGTEEWRYVYEHSPESASAFDEGYLLNLLEKHRLKLSAPIYYGQWSGRRDGLSFQDMLVIERA